MDKKTRQQIALFRHGLIGDLVHRKVGERGLYALLRDKAERVYEIPGSRRTRVAVETLRDWLDSYRRGGFDALYPQPRRDQGQARAIPQEVADHLCTIKENNRALSVALVIEQAQRCCRKVLHALHASLYRVLYVCLSTGNVMDLYKTISWEMGLPVERSRAALFRQIRAEVTRLVSEARCRPILVINEAHHLRPEVLEELRLLTNYNMDAENRLCLLLLGQSELRRRLSMAVHEALSQRIVVRYHLSPLTREELPAYLTHRLRCAGTELPIFEPPAQEALFQASGGLLLFFTLNREDFSFVIHLDRQPRTSRRREAQTGSRARSGSRSERTLDAVEHSRTLMEWWPFLIFHRGGLRIKVINNTCPAKSISSLTTLCSPPL